jgi:hypothetical protein
MTVTVAGAGTGQAARERAMALAHRIYRTYNLVLSRDVGQTHYLSVIADQPPYEQPDGTDVDYVVGIRMTRYYGDL